MSHSTFSSRFGFIMATTGAAVGLGNIWKFPYMAGDNGGSAFVLVYLLFVLFVGVPAMMGEVMLGRLGRANTVTTFKTLAQRFKASRYWILTGWLCALTLVMVLAFYSVVAGWAIPYVFDAAFGFFEGASPQQIGQHFDALLGDPVKQVLCHSAFMILTLFVVAFGVEKGIERMSRWMMPTLFLILGVLVWYASVHGDMAAAAHFLLDARFSEITPSVVIAALGHAFFTLAIGAGAMLVYGAYLPQTTKIPSSIAVITFLDVLVAVLAGFAIFPLVFAHGLTPDSGPGLMFKVLPIAFSDMPGGNVVGVLFFILLLFAAWTSSVSMAEPLVMMIKERFHVSRFTSCVWVGGLAWTLGLVSAFSFNDWSHITWHGMGLFQLMTDIPTNYLLPLGGILFAVFAGFVVPDSVCRVTLPAQGWFYIFWRICIRFVAPAGIFMVIAAHVLQG